MRLYVEGGGDAKDLKTECRKGFNLFLQKAGLAGKMPRIVACGSRGKAYDMFCTAVRQGEDALLLVDSEAPVAQQAQPGHPGNAQSRAGWLPWHHLYHSDGWYCPQNTKNTQCHLMVQCMENWFLADVGTLQRIFGQEFRPAALPATGRGGVEFVPKADVLRGLEQATRGCGRKNRYSKGRHSFKVLAELDAGRVLIASPWAQRLVENL